MRFSNQIFQTQDTPQDFLVKQARLYDCKYLLKVGEGSYAWGEMVHGNNEKIASVEGTNIVIFNVDEVRKFIRSSIMNSLSIFDDENFSQLSFDFE